MNPLFSSLMDLRFKLRLRERLGPALRVLDTVALPATALTALYMKGIRRVGIGDLNKTRELLSTIGIYPMQAHYYEPFTRKTDLRRSLDEPRPLPGLDLNEAGQLALLRTFNVQGELGELPLEQAAPNSFGFNNGTFAFGDAAFVYSLIRALKPKRWVEVGAGNSTLIARLAFDRNAREGFGSKHICIEPYEMPWLEELGIEIVRERAELSGVGIFDQLEEGDVLFIDSSHVLRPQGDVLFLYQEIIPRLKPGVMVHVHDIFTPRDYPERWIIDRMLMWDEQYLLEAFLTFNSRFEVIGALNHLYRSHFEALNSALPVFSETAREPMSFWMRVKQQ